ncbi:hypothetical protein ACUODF_55335, partial [Escherichia coli]
AFGGIVAMFSGYAYARLGASYPSNGGIIDFFRRGLGNGVFSLALSLLYLLTLAVSIAIAGIARPQTRIGITGKHRHNTAKS